MFKSVDQFRTLMGVAVVICCCTAQLAKGDDFGQFCSKPHCELADVPECFCLGLLGCPDSWENTMTETGIGQQTWTFATCATGPPAETRTVSVGGPFTCAASAGRIFDSDDCGFSDDDCKAVADQCPIFTGGDGCMSFSAGDAAIATADDYALAKVWWSADVTSTSLTLTAEHLRWEKHGSNTANHCPGEAVTTWEGTATTSLTAWVSYVIQNGTFAGPAKKYKVKSSASVNTSNSCTCAVCSPLHGGDKPPRALRIVFESNEVEWSSPTQAELQVNQGLLVIFDDNSTIVLGSFAEEGYALTSNVDGSVSFEGAHEFTFQPVLREASGARITSIRDSFTELDGDINADKLVSAEDRELMTQLLGARIGQPHYPSYSPRADFDLNGVIDDQDLEAYDSLVLGS